MSIASLFFFFIGFLGFSVTPNYNSIPVSTENEEIVEQISDLESDMNFAQCITNSGAIFYGKEWCSHCKSQKALFGDDMKYITFIDCDENRDTCTEAGISGYPSWILGNGEKLVGTQQLETLSEKTGCSLH